MGSFSIEFIDEVIEPGLLLQAVHLRRSGCLFLECQVHALMASILLWAAGFDAFDIDAQSQPPHGQFGEIVEAVGAGKRQAVIRTHGIGQPAFLKQSLESGEGRYFLR